ncbi:Ger(x)C family spore germination protein [Neobacillus terrae]|uniref:Ger(x)C family spore germination protein n=1 Tax=Neobacillus terrae TaxID=3034837 RepID=UPI001409557D|nr:Ger(x)C family spore germination protein [Neobacillus terrae]NHM33254.1 Ger(x)C family spore germination protein [Neobacillus terrae]
MKHLKPVLLIVILSSNIFFTGCSPFVDNNEIEEIAPVTFWSINPGAGGKLEISTLGPPLVKEHKRLLSLKVDLLKQGGKDFNLKYYRELKSGQLRMVLINEELAKKGIMPIINTLLTDPDISQRLYLVIVKGNFDEYIKNQVKSQPNLDYFLYRMLRHYEKKKQGEMSIINLHQFKKLLYSPFSDPILPVFKAQQTNFIYHGTAIFKDDYLKGIAHGVDDQIFQLVNNDYYLKFLPIPKYSVVLGNIRSKVHKKMNENDSKLSIRIDVNGRIEEYRGAKDIQNSIELEKFNKEIETYLEKQTLDLFKNLQQLQADPFKIGTLTLGPISKPMSEKEWLKHWKTLKVNVDYNIKIHPLTSVHE